MGLEQILVIYWPGHCGWRWRRPGRRRDRAGRGWCRRRGRCAGRSSRWACSHRCTTRTRLRQHFYLVRLGRADWWWSLSHPRILNLAIEKPVVALGENHTFIMFSSRIGMFASLGQKSWGPVWPPTRPARAWRGSAGSSWPPPGRGRRSRPGRGWARCSVACRRSGRWSGWGSWSLKKIR